MKSSYICIMLLVMSPMHKKVRCIFSSDVIQYFSLVSLLPFVKTYFQCYTKNLHPIKPPFSFINPVFHATNLIPYTDILFYIAVSNIIYIQFSSRVCTVTNTTYMKRQLTQMNFYFEIANAFMIGIISKFKSCSYL